MTREYNFGLTSLGDDEGEQHFPTLPGGSTPPRPAPPSGPYYYDVIDPRIDVGAQRAILRMRANPATAADANRMLASVKVGYIQGIYGDDLRASAQLAARLGTVRWQLVPYGRVAAPVYELDPNAPPTIIFRAQYRGDRFRLDPALLEAHHQALLFPSDDVPHEPHVMRTRGVAESEAEGEILGGHDERTLVTNTLAVPFRFICCITADFTDPRRTLTLNEQGSGTLISNRHVLTAAHVVFDNQSRHNSAFPNRFTRAENVQVIPARTWLSADSPSHAPVGVSRVRDIHFPPEWLAAAAGGTAANLAQFDYALLTLEDDVGARVPAAFSLPTDPLGYWGHKTLGPGTRILPRVPEEIRNMPVYHAGYPVDKCQNRPARRPASADELARCTARDSIFDLSDRGSTQWETAGRIVNPAAADMPGAIVHTCDMAGGQSGGPLWLYWNGYRNLIGVATGGYPDLDPPYAINNNMGVRITPRIVQQLREWMRADGVAPTL